MNTFCIYPVAQKATQFVVPQKKIKNKTIKNCKLLLSRLLAAHVEVIDGYEMIRLYKAYIRKSRRY